MICRSSDLILIFLLCLLIFSSVNVMAEKLPDDMIFLTEDYPPLSYQDNNNVTGLSTELIFKALDRMGCNISDQRIRVMTWPDAYGTALTRNNTCLYSTVRTPEREEKFHWAGPIVEIPVVLIAVNKSFKENRPDSKSLRIVAIRNDIGESVALGAGIPDDNIFRVVTVSEAIDRLIDGTSDAWVYGRYPAENLISMIAENPDSFYVLDDLSREKYYLAFNNKTDPSVSKAFQNEFDLMKMQRDADGISPYERIVARYLGPLCSQRPQSKDQVIELVTRTVKSLQIDASGTLADIQNGRHPYKNRDDPALYVSVFDTNVNLVADGGNPEYAGKNYAGKVDTNGKKYYDSIISGAIDKGSGWEEYVSSSPTESGLFEKESYYNLTTGSDKKQYIVTAGRYLSCQET